MKCRACNHNQAVHNDHAGACMQYADGNPCSCLCFCPDYLKCENCDHLQVYHCSDKECCENVQGLECACVEFVKN